jgi:hypothetical protein
MQIHHTDYYGKKRIDPCYNFIHGSAEYSFCLNDRERSDYLNKLVSRLVSILADKKVLTESDVRQIVTGDPAE